MAEDNGEHSRSGALPALGSLGGRAAAYALRPVGAAMAATLEAGASLERRVLDRVLDSDEFERILSKAVDRARVQAAVARALESEAAKRLVGSFFDSSLFDLVIERLLASDALWQLVDEVADSPSVTAAISQQGLGFADQVGDEMRARSRKADDWLERAARRLSRRPLPPASTHPDASG